MEASNELIADERAASAGRPAGAQPIQPAYRLNDAEREELHAVLDVDVNPYTDYARFLELARRIAHDRVPAFFRDMCAELRSRDPRVSPVLYLKNCPIDRVVPWLDSDDPLTSKHENKKTFVGEAFLQVITELLGTYVVGYRTANQGDMFHDIHPMRALAHTPSQKTVDTIKFHADVPNNRVRPDWVYLLSMRNDASNAVYTMFTPLAGVLREVGEEVRAILREPIFYAPHETVHVHGGQEDGFTPLKPMLLDERGYTFLAYFQGNTRSDTARGQRALRELDAAMHRLAFPVFLERGDFVAISNNTAMHGRKVVEIKDWDAHWHRWLLKTWNVDDIEAHREHLMPGRLNTSDE